MRQNVLKTLCLLLMLGSALPAQDPRERLRDPFLLTGGQLRNAFREVVAAPREWTVEILGENDQRVALGVVIGTDGEILTKASELPEKIRCKLFDRRIVEATISGSDDRFDVALLKIEANNLKVVNWSDQPIVDGQWLVSPGIGEAPVAVGVMGVQPRSIPQSVRGVLGIQMDVTGPPRIIKVFGEGGAHAAGVLEGDVILKLNDEPMESSKIVVDAVRKFRPGESIRLKLQRGEAEVDLIATLTHPFGDLLSRIAMQNQLGGELSNRRDDFPLVFQHDSVMKPRDCGGAVVNLSGQALGLNIARAGRTETYAIPVDQVQKLIDKMRTPMEPAQ